MPGTGFEPARAEAQWILSPSPVPFGYPGIEKFSGGDQHFGPTTRSSLATSAARAIEIVFHFMRRHRTPKSSHARQEIARMSLETFVNW